MKCPCGLNADYDACCGRYHAGALAPTAEALMRSRYTAYARGLFDYLAATQSYPRGDVEPVDWVGLTVHQATVNEVEFTARYLEEDRELSLHERSQFEQRDGRWLYTGGSPTVSQKKIGRNDACPCGSGKKLKACHLKANA